MIQITLEPRCLDCGRIDVLSDVREFRNDLSDEVELVEGEITCSHAATCRHMGAAPSVSAIVGEYMDANGGEKMLEGLRKAREDAGITRERVCERLGVHYNTVKNWELGATEPKATELAALAEMYGCTVEALMGFPERGSMTEDGAA